MKLLETFIFTNKFLRFLQMILTQNYSTHHFTLWNNRTVADAFINADTKEFGLKIPDCWTLFGSDVFFLFVFT